jgi:hypothetical protein
MRVRTRQRFGRTRSGLLSSEQFGLFSTLDLLRPERQFFSLHRSNLASDVATKGDNRLVLYRLRHTTPRDNVMDDGNSHTVAELHGTSVRMLETTYAHLLKDHLSATAADLTAKRRAAKGRVAAKGAHQRNS